MCDIDLKSFKLEVYDRQNIDHKSTIILLGNDKNTRKYLGDLEIMINFISDRRKKNNYDQVYIAYYNNIPIGFVSTSYFNNGYDIRYGIIPNYRGKRLASVLLKEFSEYLFKKYSEIKELNLDINEKNEASKKCAELVGYRKSGRVNYSIRRDRIMKRTNVDNICELFSKSDDVKIIAEIYYTKNGLITNIVKKEVESRNPIDILESFDFEMTKFRFYDEIEENGRIRQINYGPMIYFGKKTSKVEYLNFGSKVNMPRICEVIECDNGEIVRDVELGAITNQELIKEIERFNNKTFRLSKESGQE